MAENKQVQKLRRKLEKALAKGRDDAAIECLEELSELDPDTPRWHHKRGDLLRKRGSVPEAVASYARAVEQYAQQGFIARAVAMAKTILDLDPTRIDILERVDPQAALELYRSRRGGAAAGAPAHPMVIPEVGPPPPLPPEPDLLDDGVPGAAAHPMVIPEHAPAPPVRPPAERPPLKRPPPPPPPRPAASAANTPVTAARPARAGVITLDSISLPPPRFNPSATLELEFDEPKAPAIPAAPVPPDLHDIYADALEDVHELTIDPSAGPHETRFSKAPPRRRGDSLDLDLSDAELSPRSVPAPRDSLAPEPSASTLAKLPLFPLFADVGREALAAMMHGSELVELSHGDFAMRAGEPADALFGILEGSVRVMVPGQSIQLTLAEGDVFGEACLLQDEPRNAHAVVQGHFVGLRIPRATLFSLLQTYPSLAEVLLGMLTRRLLGNLLQTSPLFAEFSVAERGQVVRMFETRRAGAGTRLAEAGKQMDGLYISLTGKLQVTRPGEPPQVYGPGNMFGQAALLSHEPSGTDITALVNLIVLRLPREAFSQVAMQHPAMLMRVSELASSDIVCVTS